MMELDAVKQSIVRVVLGVTKKFENAFKWSAKVVIQNDDGTLEIVPENTYWPGMSKVPIRYGVPGITVKIKPGARVIFGFVGDDTTQPVVTSWEDAAVEKVEIDAAIVDLRPGKGRSIACNGDMVIVPTAVPVPVLLFSDKAGAVPAVYASPGGPVPYNATGPLYMRFGNPPSFMIAGQIVSVSPNKS